MKPDAWWHSQQTMIVCFMCCSHRTSTMNPDKQGEYLAPARRRHATDSDLAILYRDFVVRNVILSCCIQYNAIYN